MQGDTTSYNSMCDTNNTYYVFCKPNIPPSQTKTDLFQCQSNSINLKYFAIYKFKNDSLKKNVLATRKSMFTAHQLQVKNTNPLLRKEYSNDWMVLLLLLCFSLLAWVLIFSRKRTKQIIKATYANRTINQLIRDGDLFRERISLAFSIIYLLSISLFIFQISHYFLNLKQLEFYSFFFFIKILTVILGLYVLKQIIAKFIGIVFKNNTATYIYLLNKSVFNIVTGILLLPLLLFVTYSEGVINSFAINMSIVLLTLLYALRYFRYIIIGVSFSKFSHFYLFLYLCTLEILPILIIIKIIIKLIDNKL